MVIYTTIWCLIDLDFCSFQDAFVYAIVNDRKRQSLGYFINISLRFLCCSQFIIQERQCILVFVLSVVLSFQHCLLVTSTVSAFLGFSTVRTFFLFADEDRSPPFSHKTSSKASNWLCIFFPSVSLSLNNPWCITLTCSAVLLMKRLLLGPEKKKSL